MKVLAVGGGGREHAAVEALYRSGAEIYSVMKNANPGIIKRSKEYALIKETEVDKVCEFAKKCGVELAYIGPEAPLGAGLVDALEKTLFEGAQVGTAVRCVLAVHEGEIGLAVVPGMGEGYLQLIALVIDYIVLDVLAHFALQKVI